MRISPVEQINRIMAYKEQRENEKNMTTEAENRRLTLDHMVDEKFAEIFFLAKEEYDISNNSERERELYDALNKYKRELREFGEK